MQLAILHYHLNRGGVTQVIRNHLRSLSAADCGSIERVVVLYGGRRDGWPDEIAWPKRPLDVRLIRIESLEYDDVRGAGRPDPVGLSQDIAAALRTVRMTPADALLHVHNHALGKNASLPGALERLAGGGYRLLLQIHDFAEDFRPGNYRHLAEMLQGDAAFAPDLSRMEGDRLPRAAALAAQLYPQAAHIHYAVLNGRDRGILQQVFPDARRVHVVPNPVEGPGRLPDRAACRRNLAVQWDVPQGVPFVVYPVRGIRRKNVGEMLLWSAVHQKRAVFAVTLRPVNPAERVGFDRWSALANRLGLATRLGTGEVAGIGFPENLAASDALLTTSVAEGFGMVFLEASQCGRPLVGRDLPEITADFKERDVRFPWLSTGVHIPRGAVDLRSVRDGLAAAYRDVGRAYGVPGSASAAVARAEQLLDEQGLDFSMLTPALQAELIERASRDAEVREALWEANQRRFLLPDRHDAAIAAELAHNAAVVEEEYGPVSSGKRLGELYATVMASPVGTILPLEGGDAILSAFLDMSRLHPVRLET